MNESMQQCWISAGSEALQEGFREERSQSFEVRNVFGVVKQILVCFVVNFLDVRIEGYVLLIVQSLECLEHLLGVF